MPASQTSPWMMPRSTQPSVAQAGNGVVNTAPRVTQVVFPAFVDSNGYLHEARKVKMVSQAGTWVQLADGAPTPVAQMLGSASVDPALAGFRLSADPVALSQSSNDPSMPSADAVIKARTKAATKLPTTQQEIEAAVASKLVAPQQASKPDSSVPVNTPASFPGKVD
ncbi:MAG: hypothetical protein E6Q06_00840 [Candidatus Moraniibacteriota bacterium]|nr:MAG: hypothetical protein E6Q06_00840 [Candidatus Moranbacteria bacterium]